MRNDRFPVCSVVSLHTCSHSAIRMPADMRPKSRTAFSRSRDGSELIQQSHAGPSSSRCRTKPTFRSERSLGLASHLIEATSVNQGPQHRDRRYLWPTAHPPSITNREEGMKTLGRAPLHQHSAPAVAGMRSWSGGTHRHSVLLREQQPEPGKDRYRDFCRPRQHRTPCHLSPFFIWSWTLG